MVMEGALAKVGRAEEHVSVIDQALSDWRQLNPDAVTGHQNAEMTEHYFHVTWTVEPDLTRWALIAGDCVHALRSALDHCIWECAQIESLPDERRREFPIFKDRGYFFTELNKKLGGIQNTDVRAIVERVQPWQHPTPMYHHLWVTAEFDRIDKHRTLNVVAVMPREYSPKVQIEYRTDTLTDEEMMPTFVVQTGALQQNALFMTMLTPARPKKVTMQFDFMFAVGIEYEGVVNGGLSGTLSELCKYTRGVVEEIRDCLV